MLTTIVLGSKADIPKDLLNEVRKLEEIFTVDTSKLKEITDHFVNELAKGMVPPPADHADPRRHAC